LKRFFVFMTIITVLCNSQPSLKVSALGVSARYACVIDALTGNVLFEKNAHERHSMASTTKIMTALVALENAELSDVVKVSNNAAGTEGSSIYLEKGEKISLRDLLYGLMLEVSSGDIDENDNTACAYSVTSTNTCGSPERGSTVPLTGMPSAVIAAFPVRQTWIWYSVPRKRRTTVYSFQSSGMQGSIRRPS